MEQLVSNIRPQNLTEFVGQKHLVDEHKPLRMVIEKNCYLALFFRIYPELIKQL